METITLQAKTREITGKKVSELRDQDMIPAVIYGKTIKPLNISLSIKDFEKVFKQAGDTTVIDLQVDEPKALHKVLIQNVQYTPTHDRINHVELLAISLTDKVKVKVPVVLVNTANAEKLGGNLILNLDEIEIEALPSDLIHQIEIDCSIFTEFGHTIYVKDLTLNKNIKILEELDLPVVSFDEPEKIEEEVITATTEESSTETAATPKTEEAKSE
ncbi:MAG TPA: 50S ribosomal protein L25 [Candidatus Paceibacterota bacterium]|nr:50S ribosomal protein L25 [Candidatus Paceibacterota bacterium]HRZ29417.1 50S ribosomal protein L25 [Candidatus Paceibacterota bacterium]